MNFFKKTLCTVALVALPFLAPRTVSAQQTSAQEISAQEISVQEASAQQAAPLPLFNNHVSWGVNYAGGDATFGRGTILFSTAYERQLLSWLSVEASVQGFAWSEGFSFGGFPAAIKVYNNAAPALSWNSNTLFFDVTAMMQPFQGFGLRIGIGPSVRRWESSRLSIGTLTTQFPGMPEETFLTVSNDRNLSWSFGANAKLEYLIPVTQQVDVSLRLQGHIFAPAFDETSSQRYPMRMVGGGASLGAFLRLGF